MLPLSVVLYLGTGEVKLFFCLIIFTQENWIISDFKTMLLSYINNSFDLHDKLTVGVLYDGKAGCKYLNSTAVHFSNVLISVMSN